MLVYIKVMDIKEYVAFRKNSIKEEVKLAKHIPTLAIISVGNNPASASYIRGKEKDAAEVGFKCLESHFEDSVTQNEILDLIIKDNKDPSIDGILVQLPLPPTISSTAINMTIDPKKDVDGFVANSAFTCCTPKGIVDYLSFIGFAFRGKNAVVIGRSQIVGKPMAKLLLSKDCNVTMLHSKTSKEDMDFYLSHADLVVVAVGREALINHTYTFKKSAIVVDVGINRGSDNHLHGDCEPNLPVALQTPVPGGAGLLTRLALLDNLLEAVKQ